MMININEINERITANAAQFVADTDNTYFTQIREVAQHIFDGRNERPIVLLSGPSGSGKTTTAHVLEKMLDEMGCETHTLSMDNYFLTLSEEERIGAQEGTIDLESPSRLNIPFMNAQLEDITDCKPVELPVYDFPTSTSLLSGEILHRKPGELVILEGIHALNPDVVTLPDTKTEKVYISVRTRVVCDGHTIHPENVRLLRRMIRDNINRGRSFEQTCTAYKSVKRGEDLYVMPHKHRSDFDIDTFIPYELGVYKNFFKSQLENPDCGGQMGEIIRLLTPALPLSESFVPDNALIREFIGK